MHRRVVLAACALAVACGPVFEAPRAAASRQSIVGGTIDVGDEQVFQLKIVGVPTGNGSCSATLIGARTLLTAAHCLDPRRFGAMSLTIFATNKPDTSSAVATDYIKVVETRFHPLWSNISLDNDIGVALLETAPGLAPKGWNAASLATYGGKPLRAVGYGAQAPADGGGTAGIKREVALTLRQLTPDQIWIGDQESKGICAGDSGGPSFHVFSDGVERVVGVHATSSPSCLDGTDQRVDFHAAFIRAWLMEKEAAACWDDGRCVLAGCASVDLDCVCGADGMCTDKCPNLLRDPDCPPDCIDNGVCAVGVCPRPDVDCGTFSGKCSKPQDCLAGRCVTDPQHPRAYCSASCVGPGDCPAAMECDATKTCRYKQLPVVGNGGLCTPGQQLCESGAMCLAEAGSAARCIAMCSRDSDCGGVAVCAGPATAMVCRLPVTLPRARLEGRAAATGCSAAPGGLWVLLGLAALLRRRALTGA